MRRQRPSPAARRTVLIGGLVFLLSVIAALLITTRIEPSVGDFVLTRTLATAAPPAEIVIVAIDEDTLAKLPYRSPVDRGFLAALIARIDSGRPLAIGLDLLVDQPSEPQKDAALAAAIVAAEAPVVLGYGDQQDGLTARQADHVARFAAGRAIGLVTLRRDEVDGVVRRFPLSRESAGRQLTSFAEALAGTLPSDSERPTRRIVYRNDGAGGPFAFTRYPAHAVALLPPDWFTGKYVLIGADLPGLDRHGTPFIAGQGTAAGTLPGVAVHAHMLAQVLAGDRLDAAAPIAGLGLAALVAGLATIIFLVPLAPAVRIAGIAALIALYLAVAYSLLVDVGVQFPLLGPPLSAVFVGVALAFLNWVQDRRERRFIQNAFSRYLSPALVERIAAREFDLALGGEKRMVTCVFTDLEGFTGLSESLPPAEIAAILNGYLDEICALFTDAEATIDKIVGDAVVGFFGAPMAQDDQAVRAVDLALRLDAFSESHRKALAKDGIALGVTRIGVHKGEAIVGNFGGSRFFDYTAIGDTVNTAARLEGANKSLGTRIAVSGAVAAADKTHDFRPAATVVVRGRSGGIDCFAPLTAADSAEAVEAYRQGYQLMRDGSDGAAAAFNRALALNPADSLAKLHLERLHRGEKGATLKLEEK